MSTSEQPRKDLPPEYNDGWLFMKALPRVKEESKMPSWHFLKALSFILPLAASIMIGAMFFGNNIQTWIFGGLIEGTLLLFLMIRLVRRAVYNDPDFRLYKLGLAGQEESELAVLMEKTQDENERTAYRRHLDALKNLKQVLKGDHERKLLKELRQLTNSWKSFHRQNVVQMLFLTLAGSILLFWLLKRTGSYPISESCSIIGAVVLSFYVAYALIAELYWDKSSWRKQEMLDLLETELIRLNKDLDRAPKKTKDQREKLIISAQAVHIFLAGKPYAYEAHVPEKDEHLEHVARITPLDQTEQLVEG